MAAEISEEEKNQIVLKYKDIKASDKLYICVISQDGVKHFNTIDISNIKTLVIDTKLPVDIFK